MQQVLGNFASPHISEPCMHGSVLLNEQHVLVCRPLASLDVGIELIDPMMADVLTKTPGRVGSKRIPLEPKLRNKLHYQIVLLLSPRAPASGHLKCTIQSLNRDSNSG